MWASHEWLLRGVGNSSDMVTSGHCCLVRLGYVAPGWLHSTAANSDHFSGRRVNTISWCDTIPGIRFPHYTNTLWHAIYGVCHKSQPVCYLLTYHVAVCPPDLWCTHNNFDYSNVSSPPDQNVNTCILLILTVRLQWPSTRPPLKTHRSRLRTDTGLHKPVQTNFYSCSLNS